MAEKSDHDLLITIANDSKWIKEWAMTHEKNDAVSISEVRGLASAAHKRIDKINDKFTWLVISGILCILIFSFSVFYHKA